MVKLNEKKKNLFFESLNLFFQSLNWRFFASGQELALGLTIS